MSWRRKEFNKLYWVCTSLGVTTCMISFLIV
ncbi:Alanine racemase [Bienertia sinuspersici]